MKRLLAILGFLLCAIPAWSQAINPSSSTFGTNNTSVSAFGTTTACTTCGSTLNVPSGALIVAAIRYNITSAALNSVTDTTGDTFVHLSSADSNTTGNITSVWFVCSASANASESFTANLSAAEATSKNITISVYTGGLAASCNDGNGAGANGNSSSPATGMLTANQANELVIGYFFCGAGGETVGASFTSRQDDVNTGSLFEDRGTGGGLTSGSYTASGTCTSGNWGISGGLFKAAALVCSPTLGLLGVGRCG